MAKVRISALVIKAHSDIIDAFNIIDIRLAELRKLGVTCNVGVYNNRLCLHASSRGIEKLSTKANQH